jgi:DNA-binding response OmpR family regulator
MTTEPLEVLLVEDDREQADLIVDTAKLCRSSIRWTIVEDGQTALSFLRREGGFSGTARPGLMLLDLHLPKLDGFGVLRAAKSDSQLKSLPVVVMSSSRDESDIAAVYELGANCYIAKPVSFEGHCSLVRFVEAFLTLPQRPEAPAEPSPSSTAHSLN